MRFEHRERRDPAEGGPATQLGIPIKFIGVGEQADDLQPFNAKQFAEALFSVKG